MSNYKILPVKYAEGTAPGYVLFYMGGGQSVPINFYFWLIRGENRIILVDVGTKALRSDFTPGSWKDPVELLKQNKINPEDVHDVILTHLHSDHTSPVLKAFTKANIYLNRWEWEAVVSPVHPWFASIADKETVHYLLDSFDRVSLVDGNADILPGIDLFWTGGHTPGHQAVLVQTTQGRAVITGDVCFTYRNIEEDIPVGLNVNLEECFTALKRFRCDGDIVLPGHDKLVLDRWPKGIG